MPAHIAKKKAVRRVACVAKKKAARNATANVVLVASHREDAAKDGKIQSADGTTHGGAYSVLFWAFFL